MTCEHNERFRGVFNATNGCLGCECERLLARVKELEDEIDSFNDALRKARNDWEDVVDREQEALVKAKQARLNVLEEAAKAIREQCSVCGGSGLADGSHPASYVTREMAMDAGDLSLEGSIWQQEEIIECEYCSRPISVVRSLKEKP